jgi:eukaryotic-like serine/threonine-protein kinase
MQNRTAFIIIFCICIVSAACKKSKPAPAPAPIPSSNKLITAFNFMQADNPAYLTADVLGTVGTDTIKIILPQETNRTSLKPAITFTGKTISPASGTARDFSAPVSYTVTAEDNTTKTYTVIVIYKSMVYISTNYGTMYALDGMTGQEIWSVTNGKFNDGTPSVNYGTVFTCAVDGLYALDQKTGVQKWKYPITAVYTNTQYAPSPVVSNNVVYFSAWDGFVYALNAADGSLKWKTASTNGNAFYANVTLNNNLLYAGCADKKLYALNIANGTIAWTFLTGDVIYTNPLIVNNNVFTKGLNGSQYLLNGLTGTVIWSAGADGMHASATYDNGIIYTGGGTKAFGFDANTGVLVWTMNPTGGNNERSSPIILNGNIYAGSNDGKYYAHVISTKAQIWSYTTNGVGVWSSPVIADGIYYIGSAGQDIYALDAATGIVKWRKSTASAVFGSACVIDKNGIKHYPGVSGEKN